MVVFVHPGKVLILRIAIFIVSSVQNLGITKYAILLISPERDVCVSPGIFNLLITILVQSIVVILVL